MTTLLKPPGLRWVGGLSTSREVKLLLPEVRGLRFGRMKARRIFMYIHISDGDSLPSTLLPPHSGPPNLELAWPGKDFWSKMVASGVSSWQWLTKIQGITDVQVTPSNLHWMLLPTAASPRGDLVCTPRDLHLQNSPCLLESELLPGESFVLFIHLIPGRRAVPSTYCCINE